MKKTEKFSKQSKRPHFFISLLYIYGSMMQKFYSVLFVLTLLWNPSQATNSLQCKKAFQNEDGLDDLLSLKKFLQVLIELKVYSTVDFITLKTEGELPEGIPDKPLRTYSELQGKWNNLWDRVHEIRLSRGENITRQRNLNSRESQTLNKKTNDVQVQGKNQLVKIETHKTKSRKPRRRKQNQPILISQEKRKEKTLALIAENPRISILELAQKIGVSTPTVDKMIALLKKEGRLTRIGPANNGYWEILEKGATPTPYDSPAERKEKTLVLTAENPRISIPELAQKIGVSTPTVDKMIALLKKEGRLARIGPANNGYWEILEKGATPTPYDSPAERKEKTLALTAENPRISRVELAKKMEVSIPTVDKMIALLKKEGRLARIGATNNGYLEVLEKGTIPSHHKSPQAERKEKTLALITENPRISRIELAQKMEVSIPTVDKMIALLKKEGQLARIGPANNGYWEVLQKEN